MDSDMPAPPLQEGDARPMEEGFCDLVVRGLLPELMHDAADVPAARALAEEFPIGAHLSVPVRLADERSTGPSAASA